MVDALETGQPTIKTRVQETMDRLLRMICGILRVLLID